MIGRSSGPSSYNVYPRGRLYASRASHSSSHLIVSSPAWKSGSPSSAW